MALFLGAYYSNVTFMDVILRLLNPTNLQITSGAGFMENDITLSFAGNEFWIIGVTGVWMILCVKIARNFKLYDRNVSSIHKNIKKERQVYEKRISLTDFLQNADPPTLLHNSLRSNSARVGCDFAKNPMKFYHFVHLSFFMFL